MKKLIFTFVALLTMVCGANASTTLWEGTDDGSNIFIAKEKLVAGATITLEFNWLGEDGAQFSSFYYYNEGWTNIYNWQWVNNGETFSFSLTQDQIDAIPEQLGFKTNAVEKMTFKKISIDATSVTEWEGTDDGSDIFIDKSRLIAGAPITLEFNWLGSDGAQFSCFYWDGSAYQKIYNWQWVNKDNTYTFRLTQDQIDAIPEQLGFKTEVVDKMTFKKISMFKPSVSVTIGSDGIATFSSIKKLDFSGTGVTPYYVSAIATGTVTLTAATNATTWDYCGYILQGAEGTYDVPVTASATYPAAIYLKGQTSQGTVYRSVYSDYSGDATGDELTNIKTKYRYIFAKNSSGDIGFYKLTSDHTLAAHKAYLETDTDITPTGGNARLTIIFDDGQTASVNSIRERKVEEDIFYNISGQRVQNPAKGLYIVNGKKVLVR